MIGKPLGSTVMICKKMCKFAKFLIFIENHVFYRKISTKFKYARIFAKVPKL